jgi:hypothetical protein
LRSTRVFPTPVSPLTQTSGPFQLVDQKAAHCLVTAAHQRVVHPRLAHPLLRGARAQTTAKTVQAAIRMQLAKIQPLLDALRPDLRSRKLETEPHRLLLSGLLVANTDLLSLFVVQQRQVRRHRKRALREFDRGPHIDQRNIPQKQAPEIVGILKHDRA